MLQNYLLEINGRPAGRFFDFAGGTAAADIVQTSGGFGHKHVGSVKFQDMVLTCGTGMSGDFYKWIGDNLAGAPSRRGGAIVALDTKQAPSARLEFMHALISSLVLPELDAAGNKAAYMTVGITPEITRPTETEKSATLGVYVSKLPKAWNISDFRLKIDGLEKECAHVKHIDSLKLGQKIVTDARGESREYTKEPTSTEYPDLVISLPESFATGFYSWFDDSVIKGNIGPGSVKRGTLEFFAPNSSKPYFGLELTGLGIKAAQGPSGLRGKTGLPVTVEMFCDSMKFYAGPSAIM